MLRQLRSPELIHRSFLTSQKLSMLSLVDGGTVRTSLRLVKPSPSGAIVCSRKAWKIFQPHSRYIESPVTRYIMKRLSTVSGLCRLCASKGLMIKSLCHFDSAEVERCQKRPTFTGKTLTATRTTLLSIPRVRLQVVFCGVEPCNLRRKSSACDSVHAPTGFHEFDGKLHIIFMIGLPLWIATSFG